MISRALCLTLLFTALTGCLVKPADCTNGRIDGRETDLDCGGECSGCSTGLLCLTDRDCASQVCTVNRCAEPSCIDGLLNGKETGVDCGGDCAACQSVEPSCTNNLRDELETDVDCGGPCLPCGPGLSCVRNVDCANGSCADGRCGSTCPQPLLACGGGCVDPRFDRANCGGCGLPCASTEVCFAGQCGMACGGGTRSCGGTCVDPGSNPLHCGGCGRPCGVGEICAGGVCAPACPPGQVVCGADCVSLDFDGLHCGGCDQPCGAGSACVSGQCTAGCTSPLLTCGATGPTCVDPRNDPNHCGDCVTSCPARLNGSRACINTTCAPGPCMPGFEDCNMLGGDGCEAVLGSDGLNCGSCGRACFAGDTCTFGRCCGAVPTGSYQATCTNCEACDGLLTCQCDDSMQIPRQTSLPLGCPNITNCNGVLLCNGC